MKYCGSRDSTTQDCFLIMLSPFPVFLCFPPLKSSSLTFFFTECVPVCAMIAAWAFLKNLSPLAFLILSPFPVVSLIFSSIAYDACIRQFKIFFLNQVNWTISLSPPPRSRFHHRYVQFSAVPFSESLHEQFLSYIFIPLCYYQRSGNCSPCQSLPQLCASCYCCCSELLLSDLFILFLL